MDKKDIAFWIMIIVVISMSIYMSFFVEKESYQCLSDPIGYGIQKANDNGNRLLCSCSTDTNNFFVISNDGISDIR